MKAHKYIFLLFILLCIKNVYAINLNNIGPKGWFISPGFSLGVNQDKGSFTYGFELSSSYYFDENFIHLGLMIDCKNYDDTWISSFGPEFGFTFVGFDTGLLVDYKNNYGFMIRPYLIIPLNDITNKKLIYTNLIFYYKYSYFRKQSFNNELGFLFKTSINIL